MQLLHGKPEIRPFGGAPPSEAPLESSLQEPNTWKKKKRNNPFWLPAVVTNVRKGTTVFLEKLRLPTQTLKRKQALCMAQTHPGPVAVDKQQFQTLRVKVRRVSILEDHHDLNCGGS